MKPPPGDAPEARHDRRGGARRWPRWLVVLVGAALLAAHAVALRHAWARVASSGVAVAGGALVLALVVAKHLGLVAAWRLHRRRPRH